jgi:hypothetical protein
MGDGFVIEAWHSSNVFKAANSISIAAGGSGKRRFYAGMLGDNYNRWFPGLQLQSIADVYVVQLYFGLDDIIRPSTADGLLG